MNRGPWVMARPYCPETGPSKRRGWGLLPESAMQRRGDRSEADEPQKEHRQFVSLLMGVGAGVFSAWPKCINLHGRRGFW